MARLPINYDYYEPEEDIVEDEYEDNDVDNDSREFFEDDDYIDPDVYNRIEYLESVQCPN